MESWINFSTSIPPQILNSSSLGDNWGHHQLARGEFLSRRKIG
jgi:hypothetical protein